MAQALSLVESKDSGTVSTPAFHPVFTTRIGQVGFISEWYANVAGVMKMGNIAPRAGIGPTSPPVSVLSIAPTNLPGGKTCLVPTCLCGSFLA